MKDSFNDLFNTNPRYSTTISFLLGLIIVSDLTAPEQNMLGNWIILLGQTILTNAACQNIIEDRIDGSIININSNHIKKLYNPVIYDINKIRQIINTIEPEHNNANNYKNELKIIENIIKNLQNQINEIKKSN